MKKIIKCTCLVMLSFFLVSTSFLNKVNAQAGASVSFSVFYSNLSPYGQWVNDPGYGNVWVPNVDVGFRPYYTNGYWVMTEYGNTWVSSYPWGWAPFHYGRWVYDGYYGWVWVPDDVWGPAWVDWRYGGGVYGWAPLAPGISVGFALGGGYYCPDDWWIFVPQTYIYSPVVYRYYYGPRYSPSYIRSTTIINNTYVNGGATYVTGPRVSEVQRATGQPVRTYSVRDMNSPGGTSVSNGAVAIYRPRVSTSAGGRSVAPSNVVRAERPIGKPQSVTANGGKPLRLTNPTGNAAGASQNAQPSQRNTSRQNQQPAMREQSKQQPAQINHEQPRQMERMQPQQPKQQPVPMKREQPQRMEHMAPQPQREQPQQPVRHEQSKQQPPQMNREQPRQMERIQPQRQQPRQMERAPQPRQQMPQPRMEPRPMPQPREMRGPQQEREHGPKLR